MTPKEAANYIGCSVSHVRTLLRLGRMKYARVPDKNNRHGYVYFIRKSEADRIKRNPASKGWPRGKTRSSKSSSVFKPNKNEAAINELGEWISKHGSSDILEKFYSLVKKIR